eukprot:TRINITY_DN3870_c0_g1_i4.p1 TRINITY_DN3870_c0_g1~~TRINITY_DN3870_c0_g1_i4.p1  ORF type:complete len:104 (+),score=25.21 TRINITY_DN3870_c0_g1_i4:741-1052(+)
MMREERLMQQAQELAKQELDEIKAREEAEIEVGTTAQASFGAGKTKEEELAEAIELLQNSTPYYLQDAITTYNPNGDHVNYGKSNKFSRPVEESANDGAFKDE